MIQILSMIAGFLVLLVWIGGAIAMVQYLARITGVRQEKSLHDPRRIARRDSARAKRT